MSPTPLTIAVGETAAFTLGVKPTFLGIRVEVNAAGDTGNLSLNGECPGAVDAAKTSFNGLTVELLGCAAGLVSVGLYQGSVLWKGYTVTVLPAPTATATP